MRRSNFTFGSTDVYVFDIRPNGREHLLRNRGSINDPAAEHIFFSFLRETFFGYGSTVVSDIKVRLLDWQHLLHALGSIRVCSGRCSSLLNTSPYYAENDFSNQDGFTDHRAASTAPPNVSLVIDTKTQVGSLWHAQ
jgi:hypothetical protein